MGEQAVRYDKGKNRLALMSIPALWEIGQVYTMGAVKYKDRDWEKGMPYTKTMDAALRHIFKWMAGHRNDEESGLHHLAHAAWNLIALLHYELAGNYSKDLDDRSTTSLYAVPNSSEAPADPPPLLPTYSQCVHDAWMGSGECPCDDCKAVRESGNG